jgi:nicotinate-nucleotide adenylyltransferase
MGGSTGERIGVFGGTFDPPHIGHVVAAVNVRQALALDRVLMIPASIPWQKTDFRDVSLAEDRLAMLHATVDGVDGLSVSTIELDRGGESYSADTLEALAKPGSKAAPDLFLIVGSDVAPQLDTWKRPEVLKARSTIVVYDRPGSAGGVPPAGWRHEAVAVPQVDVSSTDIRARVHDGRPIDGLVVTAVARHIRSRHLYAADRRSTRDRQQAPAVGA